MNNLLIDEIVSSIDSTCSFDSVEAEISPQGKNKGRNTVHLEMPTSSLYPMTITAQGSRNNRKRLSIYLKLSFVVTAILLVASWVVSESNSSGETFNSDESSEPNSNLLDYASVERLDESKTSQETQYHSYSILDSTQISAAEMLKCPASVLNFVINATDAKDECDGLRKAFDKTCSGTHDGGNGHRRLMEEENDTALQLSATFKRFIQRITPNLRRKLQEDVTDLDEEKSALQVEDDGQTEEELEEDEEELEGEEEDEKSGETHLSLTLPTTTGHLTDEMAGDMLGLNSELSDIAKAIEEIGNMTHSEASNSTQHSASSKDEIDTAAAAAVSEIINRPEVIETQSCCRSIIQVFHDECDNPEDEEYADRRLFVIVCVIALCGMIKSLIRHFKIRWLPEAGGCILVGVVGGLFLRILPNIDFAFSHDMFLRVMVPPIGKNLSY